MTTETEALVQDEQHRGIPADTFRARLKLARLHAGDLTIREAAERSGLNYASWANWEKGIEPRGKDELVAAISEGLGVDRDWLMWGGPLAQEVRRRRGRGGMMRPSSHGVRPATSRHLTGATAHRAEAQTGQPPTIRRIPKAVDTRPRWTHGR